MHTPYSQTSYLPPLSRPFSKPPKWMSNCHGMKKSGMTVMTSGVTQAGRDKLWVCCESSTLREHNTQVSHRNRPTNTQVSHRNRPNNMQVSHRNRPNNMQVSHRNRPNNMQVPKDLLSHITQGSSGQARLGNDVRFEH